MKNSTSSTHFSGIPIDTNTLAGQWMTFSHMANHYRKLLNVKPRVNTGLVQGNNGVQNNNYISSSTTMIQSSKSQKKMGSSKKRQTLSSGNSHTNNFHLYEQQDRKNSLLFSSHPDHLNTSLGKGSSRELTSKPSLKSNSTKHNNACQPQFSDYQVVFGPSSIRSSTDAFLSDETESTMSNDNKPPSEVQAPIGVTEKIRRFLNHIHQLDLTSTNPASVKKKTRPKAVTTPASITSTANGVTGSSGKKVSSGGILVPSSASTTTSNNIDFRLSRHSKCFIPWDSSAPATSPRKSPRLTAKSSLRNNGDKPLSASISSLNRRQGKTKLGMEQSQKSSNCDQLSFRPSEVGRNRHTSSGMDIHSMLPEKDGSSGKKPGKSRRRAGSIASIGTICGSDELTAEDFPMSIKDICSTLEGGLGLMDDDLNDQLLSRIMDDNFYLGKHNKSSANDHHYHDLSYNRRPPVTTGSKPLHKSNSMASLVPTGSGSGSSANNSKTKQSNGVGGGGPPNGNNKDSSRDSAYGFSSGESRITTRESTPEKKCLNGEKSHKHQHKHRDREHSDLPSKDLYDKELGKSSSFSSEKRFHGGSNNSKVSKDHRHLRSSRRDDSPVVGLSSKTSSAHSLQRQDSSETYIALLAELTQDIVSKGIYTNKGLKALFKSYADQHKNLNQDKLADMLEHLRMDLGIPKDDALDRIEFGYGSISNATSTTYFYKPPTLQERLSSDDLMSPGNNSTITTAQPPSSTLPGNNRLTNSSNHPRPPESIQSDSPSPTTIIPTSILPDAVTPAPTTTTGFSSSGCPNTSSNRSTTTTEEGSGDIPSDNDNNYKHDHDDHDDEGEGDEEDSLGVGKGDDIEDELSLSESEVTQALKFAGLDDCTMEELVGILKS